MEETETKQQKGNVKAAGNPGQSHGAVKTSEKMLGENRWNCGLSKGEYFLSVPFVYGIFV